MPGRGPRPDGGLGPSIPGLELGNVVVGVGVDLVELDRFRRTVERSPRILDRLFTAGEREYCEAKRDPAERYAARFAAKEAVLKALGQGISGGPLTAVEVVRDADSQAPSLVLHGWVAATAAAKGVDDWRLTLTHTDRAAEAIAVALGRRRGSARRFSMCERVGGMIPIVTPAEMAAIDGEAPEPVEVLIGRAGGAVARAARRLLGGTYGRRVVVLAGKGNNGNDGRQAARRLRREGVRVTVVDVADAPAVLPPSDLVVDAAFGTGFRGEYLAPDPAGAPVLAVDIPSGVDGLTGRTSGRVLPAVSTVSFAALKPGLVLEPGASLAGTVDVVDIGLDVSSARAHLLTGAEVAEWLPSRPATAHKWQSAVWIVGGSPGLEGAAVLTSSSAVRAGAGYVRWSSPGDTPSLLKPTEVVGTPLPHAAWAEEVLRDAHRFGALCIGNGLGLDPRHRSEIRRVVAEAGIPVVLDADALTLLGDAAAEVVGPTTVLTPHDGEFARLAGSPPGDDRLDATRTLAASLGAVVLLKGAATVVAAPDGRVLVTRSGDARLATLGTGDVLAGVVGAFCAQGMDPFLAAASGAHVHGRAASFGPRHGLAAPDLVDLVPLALDDLVGE